MGTVLETRIRAVVFAKICSRVTPLLRTMFHHKDHIGSQI